MPVVMFQLLLKKYEMKCEDRRSDYVQCLGDMAIEGEGGDVCWQHHGWRHTKKAATGLRKSISGKS